MNRDPILFRVDGTTQTGWERLTRCLTYAAALQRRRRPTYFLSQLEPGNLGLSIKRAGNDWLEADGPAGTEDDLAEFVQEIRRLQPAAVVVDVPDATEDYLAELVATGTLVVSMDNSANVRLASQLVVNPLLSPGREAYEFLPGTQLLLGPRYALVRPEIRRIRPVRSQEPAQPFRALVALGDDDPNHQTGALARQLLNVPRLERIDLAVRPFHPDLAKLQELAAANPDRLEFATEPADVASRVARCHFAVTSGGGWSLELACVGVPQLVIVQAEVHWPTAQRLEDEGAAVCLGWHENVSAGTIRQAVLNLLGDPLDRQAMSRCGRKLIDGRGPDRLVTALEVLLHPSRLVDLNEAA
ncbi:MAG TPA: polysaccharide biosynthesis protein [Gemmataceae bacterium]|jgi:spore coat polysaccharide biosynthesis predicted glycosyltransferase SpsG|nr:polysaccharide biosynthesis protein [Gemmataceae bacterium]